MPLRDSQLGACLEYKKIGKSYRLRNRCIVRMYMPVNTNEFFIFFAVAPLHFGDHFITNIFLDSLMNIGSKGS
jgi:hypothetical protein